jgi:hypothetical protein
VPLKGSKHYTPLVHTRHLPGRLVVGMFARREVGDMKLFQFSAFAIPEVDFFVFF